MTGKEMRQMRERLGLTQKELADKLGYQSYLSVHLWETGKRRIPVRTQLTFQSITAPLLGSPNNGPQAASSESSAEKGA